MEIAPATPTIIRPPDPPPPPPSHSFDLSPLEFLVILFAVVIIPTLIYTFFLFVKCPPNPFHRRHLRQNLSDSSRTSAAEELTGTNRRSGTEVVTDVKYKKEEHVKSVGGECPVCLSAFADGEEVRQLTVCKHSFHDSCIDMWLDSHSSCPVCRASVAVKKSGRGTSVVAGEGDFRQGLPDSDSLV